MPDKPQEDGPAQQLLRLQKNRRAIEALPEGSMKQRMLAANTASIRQAQATAGPPTESLWDRGKAKALDLFEGALTLDETLDREGKLPLEGKGMGQRDRARHMLWMQNLAKKYGRPAAFVIGAFNEAGGIFDPALIAMRDIPKGVDPATINERQFESLKEIGRDLKTNLFALRNMPYDEDGNLRTFTDEELVKIAQGLETNESPMDRRPITEAPTGVLPYPDRDVTIRRYEPPAEPQGQIKFGPIQREEPTPEEITSMVPFQPPGEHFREVLQPPAIKDRPPGDPRWRGTQAITSGDGPIGGPAEPISERLRRRMVRTDI
jgi:hypothetical protein